VLETQAAPVSQAGGRAAKTTSTSERWDTARGRIVRPISSGARYMTSRNASAVEGPAGRTSQCDRAAPGRQRRRPAAER